MVGVHHNFDAPTREIAVVLVEGTGLKVLELLAIVCPLDLAMFVEHSLLDDVLR